MTDQEIPQLAAETESTDHDKEALATALRETGARIDTLFAEQGNVDLPETDNPTPSEVGDRHNVRIERTIDPDDNKSYLVRYVEKVVPTQPDGNKPNYNPYDFRVVNFKWQLDADGNPVESSYNSDGPYAPETAENTVKGDLIVENFGDDRKFGVLDSSASLEAIRDANDTVTQAETAGKLTLEDKPYATEETETEETEPRSQGRLAQLRKLGRNLLNK